MMSSGGNKTAASASNASRTNNNSKNASPAADSPLPPMLSPTLPAWVDEGAPPIPQRMLSPTLPAVFDTPSLRESEKASESSFMVSLKLPEKAKGKPVGLGIQQKAAAATNGSAAVSAKRKPSKNAAAEAKRQRISRSYSSSSSESESEQPLAARKTPSVNSTTNSTSNNKTGNGATPRIHEASSSEQRERYCKLYRSKMRSWMGVAKQKKHEADQASSDGKAKTAAAISLDSVLCFVVAFDYEDKADVVMKTMLRPHSWYTLVPYMSQLIKMLDRANCKELMGLCYQFRALIYSRIAQSYSQAVKKMTQTGQASVSFDQNNDTTTTNSTTTNDDKKETLGTISNKYISMQEASQHDFKRGFQLLTLDTIKRQFPITWKSKQRSPSPLPKQDGGSFRPTEDSYHLPLHTFSTLQEATAVGYKILREWADSNNISADWAIANRPSN
ncbi:hypothetical protein TRICI_006452 [Trichomonascus ciferrii]|uniref:Ell binding protein Ebp1 C-terminal domain-containing protein n=1 Tax=Trichomonascus ciferrii TaxID=44093 RepID=A0A642UH58_9ASCO|nr:hypothetical protein TRICI_006452 [Trichomonascus ciferrii]